MRAALVKANRLLLCINTLNCAKHSNLNFKLNAQANDSNKPPVRLGEMEHSFCLEGSIH